MCSINVNRLFFKTNGVITDIIFFVVMLKFFFDILLCLLSEDLEVLLLIG